MWSLYISGKSFCFSNLCFNVHSQQKQAESIKEVKLLRCKALSLKWKLDFTLKYLCTASRLGETFRNCLYYLLSGLSRYSRDQFIEKSKEHEKSKSCSFQFCLTLYCTSKAQGVMHVPLLIRPKTLTSPRILTRMVNSGLRTRLCWMK